MDKQERLDRHYLRIAFLAADRSKDPNTKVGAIVVHANGRAVSLGYNGFPRGVDESPEKWERPEKYERVVHAEENALLNAPFDTEGGTLYCTLRPCHPCLGKIINAGIRRVVWYSVETRPYIRADIAEEWLNQLEHTIIEHDDIIEGMKALLKSQGVKEN